MAKTVISEKIKQFIFEQIDSVEQLEVLLLLRSHKTSSWNIDQIAQELRSSPNSVSNRIKSLSNIGLVELQADSKVHFVYKETNPEFEAILQELGELYKSRKQTILELIFSPLKRGRHFANAFLVNPSKKEEEDNNG